MQPFKPGDRSLKPVIKSIAYISGYKTNSNIWIDKKEVLENMRISERTLQNWRSKGILPFYKIGGRIYYKEADLEAILEKNLCIGIEKRN